MRGNYLYIIMMFFLSTIISCQKEELLEEIEQIHLQGVWYEEEYLEDYNVISRLEYHFKEDSILEVYRMELNAGTGKLIGYRFKAQGKYYLVGHELSFTYLKTYVNDAFYLVPHANKNEYVGKDIPQTHSVTIEISKDGNTLVFYYPPCLPDANCISSKTLKKQP
jgi:hypothetical protein